MRRHCIPRASLSPLLPERWRGKIKGNRYTENFHSRLHQVLRNTARSPPPLPHYWRNHATSICLRWPSFEKNWTTFNALIEFMSVCWIISLGSSILAIRNIDPKVVRSWRKNMTLQSILRALHTRTTKLYSILPYVHRAPRENPRTLRGILHECRITMKSWPSALQHYAHGSPL